MPHRGIVIHDKHAAGLNLDFMAAGPATAEETYMHDSYSPQCFTPTCQIGCAAACGKGKVRMGFIRN
jgi:hypothetical protein